jgi:hypothetical protein
MTGTGDWNQWSGGTSGSTSNFAPSTPVSLHGGPPIDPAQAYYGGQTPSAHQYGSSVLSPAPSTSLQPHSITKGPYDPNAPHGQQYQPPSVNPYYQDQHVPPPARTEQYGQPPPTVPYNEYGQPPAPVPYNQYGQQPPSPAGHAQQQYPSSGYGGNGY